MTIKKASCVRRKRANNVNIFQTVYLVPSTYFNRHFLVFTFYQKHIQIRNRLKYLFSVPFLIEYSTHKIY